MNECNLQSTRTLFSDYTALSAHSRLPRYRQRRRQEAAALVVFTRSGGGGAQYTHSPAGEGVGGSHNVGSRGRFRTPPAAEPITRFPNFELPSL